MEIEFKFQIPPDRLPVLQDTVTSLGCTRTRLQARYFDTPTGALSVQGVALRLRKEGRRWVQTAKALGEGPVQRLEHNVDLGLQRKGEAFMAQPERHAGTPVGARLAEALAAADAPLVEVYGTDIWRTASVVAQGRSRIELALDKGFVLAPAPGGGAPRRAPVCELELELLEGEVSDLAVLASQWATRHGLWLSTITKSERGLRLARGPAAVATSEATPPRQADRARGRDGLAMQRAAVSNCLAQVLPHATEVASGSEDTAHIDPLRAGLRRLRTAVRKIGPLPMGPGAPWAPALTQVLDSLDRRQTAQRRALTLQPGPQAANAPGSKRPEAETRPQAGAPATPMAAVQAAAFQAALVGLIGFAASTPSGGAAS